MEEVKEYTQTGSGVHIIGEYEGNYINGNFDFVGIERENIDGTDTVHLYRYESNEYGLTAIFKVFQAPEMIEEDILDFVEFEI